MYAISLFITSKFIAFMALAIKALYGMRTAAGVAAFAFRALWGAATLGLAVAVPFIIENWDRIVRVFDVTIDAIADKWAALMQGFRDAFAWLKSGSWDWKRMRQKPARNRPVHAG